ncbi:hypothetical protein EAS64_38770 [Trebonia kvetii]|uniref:Uncharacterized protein n=1 Tax=Trebonia kvetii TaxID=2480626 RepID=A0A6P2BN26_9ACTN|nr:hypothetical protein [Trebonia kvetii]TVZ00027.1 hypothetical protein EAS64_38770 [Trebonia kvetii]
MGERGWGWTPSKIRRVRFIEWLVPQSSSATYVPIKPFYDAQPDADALTTQVVHDELRELEQQSLIHLAAGLGGIEGFDALATAKGRLLAEDVQAGRADMRQRRAACRDAMVDWLSSQDASTSLRQPSRDLMLADPRYGTWLAEPFSEADLDAAAAWLRRQGLVDGVTVDECEGPVRLYLTDAGVLCAEEFCSDTVQYVAAQRSTASNAVTIHGPASGVVVGSHGVTQRAGDAVQTTQLDVAALARFADAVALALPALGLAPREQEDARILTGEIVQAASKLRPDQHKLRVLGQSLRTILEGTASNVLAATLLGLWHG